MNGSRRCQEIGDCQKAIAAQRAQHGGLNARDTQLIAWLEQAGYPVRDPLTPASRDASFRRYYRLPHEDGSVIVMDAPPPMEDAGRFVRLARGFAQWGLRVPAVLAADAARGFVVLEDFGTTQYFQALNDDCVDRLYGQALDALWVLQGAAVRSDPAARTLPDYDHDLLLDEMRLFDVWLIEAHLRIGDADVQILYDAYERLTAEALEQPRVVVHRDFHSRNLMVLPEGGPGILDFQDAVWGPVTYDLVSLLKDCYVARPVERVRDWALTHYARLMAAGVLEAETDAARFLRWFDFMGVQRHLKAAGIFARLLHRDGRDGYVQDLPLTLGYVVEVCGRYPELQALGAWLETHVQPRIPLRSPPGRWA